MVLYPSKYFALTFYLNISLFIYIISFQIIFYVSFFHFAYVAQYSLYSLFILCDIERSPF